MPSILDLAKSCEASYTNDPYLAGWTTLHTYGPRPSGFFGVLFIRETPAGDEAILAFRGTDGLLDGDMASNRDILQGRMVRQYRDALSALQNALKRSDTATDFYMTGHSLGGGLAALCSVDKWRRGVRDLPVVTFNAPGVLASARQLWDQGTLWSRELSQATLQAYHSSYRKALHIQTSGDYVAHHGTPTMRRLLTLPDLQCEVHRPYTHSNRDLAYQTLYNTTRTALCIHSISNLVKVLESDPSYQEPLDW